MYVHAAIKRKSHIAELESTFMSRENNQQATKKQQQIIDTGEALFLRHGIKRVTVEEICGKAGVSKMTFYKYFRNKLDLAKHIRSLWIAEGCDKLDEIDALDVPFPEKMKAILDYKLEWTERMSAESISEFLQFYTELDHSKMMGRILAFFRHAEENGELRRGVRPEFLLAAREKIAELAQDEQLIAIYPSYADFVREVWDFFFYGILAQPNSE